MRLPDPGMTVVSPISTFRTHPPPFHDSHFLPVPEMNVLSPDGCFVTYGYVLCPPCGFLLLARDGLHVALSPFSVFAASSLRSIRRIFSSHQPRDGKKSNRDPLSRSDSNTLKSARDH